MFFYLLMYCASTHGDFKKLHKDGPECRPVAVYTCMTRAVEDATRACMKDPNAYLVTPEERECRLHYWVMATEIK